VAVGRVPSSQQVRQAERVDAAEWNERYSATTELQWGMTPNRWVEAQLATSSPGRALDLGAGEGRNALWLAERGWEVTAVDFAQAGLDKGRRLEATSGRSTVTWVCVDVTTYVPEAGGYDLALLAYLHLVPPQRRDVLQRAAASLRPGGVLLVIGHDTTNLTDGVGGPQEAAVLFTAEDVVSDVPGLRVDLAGRLQRPVGDREAIDAIVRLVAS
jgi:SAM-dependent methyltransferase